MLLLCIDAAIVLLCSYAAWVDARTRIFPNWLFCTLLALSLGALVIGFSLPLVFRRLLVAVLTCGALAVFEVFWRVRKGESGVGMGDIKALFVLMLTGTGAWRGVLAFALGLLAMAFACLLRGERSMPLLPFMVPAFLLLWLAGPFLVACF